MTKPKLDDLLKLPVPERIDVATFGGKVHSHKPEMRQQKDRMRAQSAAAAKKRSSR
jgi:hypothetical protein